MIDRLQQFIEHNKLCTKDDKILIAVSGGVDSVVLLYLMEKAGYDVAAAHFNFKLRGKESDDDEMFVREFCDKLGVRLFVKSKNTALFAKEENLSIQEAARKLRYDFFDELSKANGFTKIAVAHHAGDDMETFFINFFRGSGIKGLKGIPVKRGKIIRPLMFANRKEIEEFARINNLSWREDSSNASDKYLRNKIRHRLLPVIEEITGKEQGGFSSLKLLKDDALLFERLIDKQKKRFIELKGETEIIDLEKVETEFSLDEILYYLINGYGFNKSNTEDIINSFRTNNSGAVFSSVDYIALLDRGKLLLKKKSEKENFEFFIEEGVDAVKEPFEMFVKIVDAKDIKIEDLKKSSNAFFDMDKITFPLKIRKWKEGDRFYPYGMKGSKLLSDFFTDIKLNRFQKEDVWIIESAGEIIWITGYRTSEKHKVLKNSKKVLKLSVIS